MMVSHLEKADKSSFSYIVVRWYSIPALMPMKSNLFLHPLDDFLTCSFTACTLCSASIHIMYGVARGPGVCGMSERMDTGHGVLRGAIAACLAAKT